MIVHGCVFYHTELDSAILRNCRFPGYKYSQRIKLSICHCLLSKDHVSWVKSNVLLLWYCKNTAYILWDSQYNWCWCLLHWGMDLVRQLWHILWCENWRTLIIQDFLLSSFHHISNISNINCGHQRAATSNLYRMSFFQCTIADWKRFPADITASHLLS